MVMIMMMITGESIRGDDSDRDSTGWRSSLGSSFQRRGEAWRKEHWTVEADTVTDRLARRSTTSSCHTRKTAIFGQNPKRKWKLTATVNTNLQIQKL